METTVTTQSNRGEGTLIAGSSSVMIGGLAAIVLSIIGLVRVVPHYMLTIAVIVLGVALLFEGGMFAGEYGRLARRAGTVGRTGASAALGGGVSTEALAGVAAITLGILALLNVVPTVLTSVASIVIGAGFILASGVMARLSTMRVDVAVESSAGVQVANEAMTAAASMQVLAGVAGIVLGILALIGVVPLILNLVAMLVFGAVLLLTGGAMAGRLSVGGV